MPRKREQHTFGHWAAADAPTAQPKRAPRVADAREVIRKATGSTGAKTPAAKQAQPAARPPASKRSVDVTREFRVRADLEVLAGRRKTREALIDTGGASIERPVTATRTRASLERLAERRTVSEPAVVSDAEEQAWEQVVELARPLLVNHPAADSPRSPARPPSGRPNRPQPR